MANKINQVEITRRRSKTIQDQHVLCKRNRYVTRHCIETRHYYYLNPYIIMVDNQQLLTIYSTHSGKNLQFQLKLPKNECKFKEI